MVRTMNIAFLMLSDARFDVPACIRSLRPAAFGIDLHWMPHCHGAIELARICKAEHPDIPVVFGGLSSTVYHEELAAYDCIDYVIRGDSTEEPFRQLMTYLLRTRGGNNARAGTHSPARAADTPASLADIPNLTRTDASGAVIANDITYSPDDFNAPALDFSYNMKSVIRYRDLWGSVPFKQWLGYPMAAGLVCRGCSHDCVTCGGSCTTYRKHYGRRRVAFRDPELMVRDIAFAQRYIPGPVFVLNDFLQAGPDYTRTFIEGLGRVGVKSSIGFELFRPPTAELYELMAENLADWSIEVSAESHDDALRARFGKGHYTMAELEDSIRLALDAGAARFDLYFMSGIPGQTADSVVQTARYIDDLYHRLDDDPRLVANIAPMAPFLDPGSIAFDDPATHGYRLRAHTLAEHRELLLEPSWKHIMNYESTSLAADDLVEVTYETGLLVNETKARVGLNTPETAAATRARIREARDVMRRLDRDGNLPAADVAALNESTICEKAELNWPVNLFTPSVIAACAKILVVENLKNLFSGGTVPATSRVHEQWEREQRPSERNVT
jgi:B12-binding domain/radical SAM domain protein